MFNKSAASTDLILPKQIDEGVDGFLVDGNFWEERSYLEEHVNTTGPQYTVQHQHCH